MCYSVYSDKQNSDSVYGWHILVAIWRHYKRQVENCLGNTILLFSSIYICWSTTSLEFLYLEEGALPIQRIISCRRQSNLIADDLKNMDRQMEFKDIENMSSGAFKTMVKKNMKQCSFEQIKKLQAKH